jgi:hypothetical protein
LQLRNPTPTKVNLAAIGGHSPVGSNITLDPNGTDISIGTNGMLGWLSIWGAQSNNITTTQPYYRSQWYDTTTHLTQLDYRVDNNSPLAPHSPFRSGPSQSLGGGMYVTAGDKFSYYLDQSLGSLTRTLFGLVVTLLEF